MLPIMPGWMVQRYGNVPAVWNVNLNWPPGAIVPELHAPLFAVEVCATLSWLVQVTAVPTPTVKGLGPNAADPKLDAPEGIVTVVDPGGGGDGGGDGAEGEELFPQAPIRTVTRMANSPATPMRTYRCDI
jgi:hypothetical protein